MSMGRKFKLIAIRSTCHAARCIWSFMSVSLQLVRELFSNMDKDLKLKLFDAIISSSDDAIISKTTDGIITSWNRGAEAIFDYTADEMVGKSILALMPPGHEGEEHDILERILCGEKVDHFETVRLRKDGVLIDVSVTISPIRDNEGNIIGASKIARDISLLKKHQQKIEYLAYHDSLTGLPNRVLIIDRMRQALSQAERTNYSFAICYIDLDGFKQVNDNYGHTAGDALLLEIATRMQNSVRPYDTVGRMGGDEFVLLLPNYPETPDDYQLVMHRILDEINKPIVLNDANEVNVSVSMGVTLFPNDSGDPDLLLHHAEAAMYQAKQLGRNHICLYGDHADR
jgi:diguanylate cyclase (GGDEF)-like protein/PAS domain S-box-containing protein